MANSNLGPYEIVSPLGAGGMREVYRATDTRLARTVGTILNGQLASEEGLFNCQMADLSARAAFVLGFRITRSNVSAADIGDLPGAAIAHRQF